MGLCFSNNAKSGDQVFLRLRFRGDMVSFKHPQIVFRRAGSWQALQPKSLDEAELSHDSYHSYDIHVCSPPQKLPYKPVPLSNLRPNLPPSSSKKKNTHPSPRETKLSSARPRMHAGSGVVEGCAVPARLQGCAHLEYLSSESFRA